MDTLKGAHLHAPMLSIYGIRLRIIDKLKPKRIDMNGRLAKVYFWLRRWRMRNGCSRTALSGGRSTHLLLQEIVYEVNIFESIEIVLSFHPVANNENGSFSYIVIASGKNLPFAIYGEC